MSWYYKLGGVTQAPIERAKLVELLRTGTLMPQTEVSEDGIQWMIVPQVPGLMAEVYQPIAVAATPAPPLIQVPTELANPTPVSPALDPQLDPELMLEPEPEQPSGPIGHLVLNPSARAEALSKPQSSGVLKLVAWGSIGLVAVLIIGFFTATKVFGLDFRPSRIDQSVSKFMIENPELVAHIDIDAVLTSKAFYRSGVAEQLESNPTLSYLKDAKDVIIVTDTLDLKNPRFLAIINLKRDYRPEFIANLFRDGATETIGNYQLHTNIEGLAGMPIAASLPDPRTLLVGNPFAVKSVLQRNQHPSLYPRESELITRATSNGKVFSVGMFFDYLETSIDKLKRETDAQKEKLNDDQRKQIASLTGDMEQMFNDVRYAVKNIHHLSIEVDLGEQLTTTMQAECGNHSKAKKVAKIVNTLAKSSLASSATNGLDKLAQTTPQAKGSIVESVSSINLSDLTKGMTAAIPSEEF